jgi:hypothetical protein
MIYKDASTRQTVILLTLLASISTVLFEVLPEDNIASSIEWGGFEGIIVRQTQEHNITNLPLFSSYASRIASVIHDLRNNIVKLNISDMNFTTAEYTKIQSMLKEWDMDMAEFCKYCMLSVVESHTE